MNLGPQEERQKRPEPCKATKAWFFDGKPRWEVAGDIENRFRKSKASLSLRHPLFIHTSSNYVGYLPCAWPSFQVPGRGSQSLFSWAECGTRGGHRQQ